MRRIVAFNLMLILGMVRMGFAGEVELADEIVQMTGARTRIVWAHEITGKSKNDEYGWAPDYQLMGLDTDERTPRVILPGPASFGDPLITPDGKRIIYTEADAGRGGVSSPGTVYILDWDGRNKTKLFEHTRALAVWQDPATGAIWVYIGDNNITRYLLDDLKTKQVVWTKCPTGHWFGVSADGTRALLTPPPNILMAVLPDRGQRTYEAGCNASIAPDNSYRIMMFGAPIAHEGVLMFDPGHRNKRVIPFDTYPNHGLHRGSSVSPRWSNDVRFFTVGWPNSGPQAEVHMGQFNDDFSRVVKWINLSRMPGQDSKPIAWIDPGLGNYAGEAPFTVEVPAFRLPAGSWQWDFGDGTEKGSGPFSASQHAYTKPGRYTITAKQGDRIIKGRVEVQEHKAPIITDAQLYDSTHLSVHFNKRVRLSDPRVVLKSGVAVKSAQLDVEEQELIIELQDKLAQNDELELSGITDLAQVPLPLAAKGVSVARSAWPSRRDDLVFLFETRKAPHFFYDPKNGVFRELDLNKAREATFDRDGVMAFYGGAIFAVASETGAVARCIQSKQLSIEAVITPPFAQGTSQLTARILWYGRGGADQYGRSIGMALCQEGDKLVIYFRNKPVTGKPDDSSRIELCALAMGRPNHIVISCQPGRLVCYLDGKPVKETSELGDGPYWTVNSDSSRGCTFGSESGIQGMRRPPESWQGKLEGIAIYSRTMDAAEAARNCELSLQRVRGRPVLPQTEVHATLTATTPTPTIVQIAPYRSALLAYEYTVDQVLKGDAALKKVRVFQWGIVDHKLKPVTAAAKGTKAHLLLESFNDHPELGAELQRDGLPDDDSVLYFAEVDAFIPPGPLLPHTSTENTDIRSVQASTPPVIDGRANEWDLAAGILVCGDVEQMRDTQSAWVHMMHDAENLYVLARWRDSTPLDNPGSGSLKETGYNGDCLQFRIRTAKKTPQDRCAHVTCWRGRDQADVVDIVYGQGLNEGHVKNARESGARQAFAVDADGRGYVQELAIPWSLLTTNGKPPATADATIELSFTGLNGRTNACDLLQAGTINLGTATFNLSHRWGTITFVQDKKVEPRSVRLADGREFPVTISPAGPQVEWKGLLPK